VTEESDGSPSKDTDEDAAVRLAIQIAATAGMVVFMNHVMGPSQPEFNALELGRIAIYGLAGLGAGRLLSLVLARLEE
jgi:hypothetical protein